MNSLPFSFHSDPIRKEAEAQRGEAIYSKHTSSARARVQVQVPVSCAHSHMIPPPNVVIAFKDID